MRTFEKQQKQNSKLFWLFHGGCPYHTETNQSIFTADLLTGFQWCGALCHLWSLETSACFSFHIIFITSYHISYHIMFCNCYKIILCWSMFDQCFLLVLPEKNRMFFDVFRLKQRGHWLSMGSCVLCFSFIQIRSVLYGFRFYNLSKILYFYPRINKALIMIIMINNFLLIPAKVVKFFNKKVKNENKSPQSFYLASIFIVKN